MSTGRSWEWELIFSKQIISLGLFFWKHETHPNTCEIFKVILITFPLQAAVIQTVWPHCSSSVKTHKIKIVPSAKHWHWLKTKLQSSQVKRHSEMQLIVRLQVYWNDVVYTQNQSTITAFEVRHANFFQSTPQYYSFKSTVNLSHTSLVNSRTVLKSNAWWTEQGKNKQQTKVK